MDSFQLERRSFLRFGLLGIASLCLSLIGCKKRFVRPGGIHDLGEVQDYSFPASISPYALFI